MQMRPPRSAYLGSAFQLPSAPHSLVALPQYGQGARESRWRARQCLNPSVILADARAMGAPVGVCKLCGQTGPLSRSHIVPEFAYAPIKNDKNQMCAVGETRKTVQVGYRERMLCSVCETLLSGYETKFKRLWMDSIPPDFSHLATGPLEDVISVDVPDYDAFKLFHLSVFWRAAASTGFKIGNISFGLYEKEIATLIREGNPGAVGDFPFLAVLNLDDHGRPMPTVSQLAQGSGRFERRHHYYMMSYAFCDWTFVLARPGPQWMVELEAHCRQARRFLLHTVPFRQSKSFKLSAEMIRLIRNAPT